MQQWVSFWQSVSAAAFLASVGALLKMYSLGIQQVEQIGRLREEIKDERDHNDRQDGRHNAAEVMLARIDANVTELLQLRRSEGRAS